MQVFEQELTVSKDDLDELHHVNNVRYVQWVQDVAKAHWFSKATSHMLEHYFWVVVSHHIEYKQSAVLHDNILLKTYVPHADGVTSTRIVEMYLKDSGKLLVKAETKWCFMDANTKRPTRIPQEIAILFD